jgi:hypothetical protein
MRSAPASAPSVSAADASKSAALVRDSHQGPQVRSATRRPALPRRRASEAAAPPSRGAHARSGAPAPCWARAHRLPGRRRRRRQAGSWAGASSIGFPEALALLDGRGPSRARPWRSLRRARQPAWRRSPVGPGPGSAISWLPTAGSSSPIRHRYETLAAHLARVASLGGHAGARRAWTSAAPRVRQPRHHLHPDRRTAGDLRPAAGGFRWRSDRPDRQLWKRFAAEGSA